MIGPNHTYRLRNVRTNLEVKSLVNAMRLKPYYDPKDRPTNPPEQLADNEDELDPEELDQPRRQTEGKTDNTEIQQGKNQNDNQANRNQNKNDSAEPEGPTEPGSSKQETNVSESTKTKGTKGNESVKPRDGTQTNGTKERPRKVNEANSGKNEPNSRKTAGKDTGPRQVQQKGSENKSGINDRDSIACRRKPQENESHQGNKKKNHESRKGNEKENKQENLKSRSNENSGKKTEQKHKSANKAAMKQSAQEAAGSNSGKTDKTKQDNQNQPKTSQNSNGSKQKKQGKKSVIPSCIDCKAGNCKPINEQDIKAIVASQRSNGALYYKLKWQDNSTDWYFPCKIPSHLIREYHANRTMSGKKRKKPLHDKQHKFFTETEPQVNVAAKQIESEINSYPVLLAVKIINGRSYYLVKNGNGSPQWQPICMAHDLASDMITRIFREREDLLYRLKVQAAQESNQPPKPNQPAHCPTVRYVHEMELREDGHWYCLLSFTKPEIPPQWQNLNDMPPGISELFIKFLSKEYETYVDTDPYSSF